MNKLEIDNLKLLVRSNFGHICLNPDDLKQFRNIPWEERNFYPCKDKRLYDKKGFYKNGNLTMTIWTSHIVSPSHIKISDKFPGSGFDTVWSDQFFFGEENSVVKISKIMKLKVFW